MRINTSRGAVVDLRGLIRALKPGCLGSLGLDVYQEEGDLFFRELSAEVLHADVFVRLLALAHLVVTGHQSFFTEDGMRAIAQCAIAYLDTFEAEGGARHAVSVAHLA